MDKISTLEQLINYYEERNFSTYERDNFDAFLKKIKFNYKVPSIHVTGTNGKGSVVKFLNNIYVDNNYKVATFTSPYFINPLDSISINDKEVSLDKYLAIFNEYVSYFDKYNLSSFEIQSFIALTMFNNEDVDIAIIEVGMGGDIDATNCFEPILSIITRVALEHTSYLGRTISEIAESKAGIIKYKTPVLIGKLVDAAKEVVIDIAKYNKSPIYLLDDYYNDKYDKDITFTYRPYSDLKLSTKARYQIENATIAIEASNILNNIFPVKEEGIKKALYRFNNDCRFEYIDKNIIVDGAHNPDAINALMDSLVKDNISFHCLFASFKDKNIDSMLSRINMDAKSITLTTFDHKRARNEDDYLLYLGDYPFKEDYLNALNELKETYKEDIILVTGSLAFAFLVKDTYKR